MCVLLELGFHNPVRAAVSLEGEGEWSLAAKILKLLPKRSLLIVDRLYACGAYVKQLLDGYRAAKSELLLKARGNVKSRKAERLSDGNALVSINQRQKGRANRVVGQLRVREIRRRIKKPGCRKWSAVRLWTTLFDEKLHPTEELLSLYAMRWDQEIFYKDLKIELQGGDLLQSNTPVTTAQEVAALPMGCSIIAQQRSEAARRGNLQPLSISFVKTYEKIRSLWEVLLAAEGC